MTAPILRFYDGGTDDLVAAPQALTQTTPGTPGTALELDYWNDKDGDGADTAYNRAFQLLTKDADGNYVSAGTEATDNYWIEARITEGLGDLVLAAGAWQPLGAGRWLEVPTLASEQGVKYEFRLNAPGAPNAATSVEWALSPYRRGSRPLPVGLHESYGPGINLGIGDDTVTQLIYVGGNVVENPGGADEFVQIDDVSVVDAGVPKNIVLHLEELTNLDGAAAALAAGESYYALLYAAATGIEIAKGSKTATPGPDDKPALRDGAIAYVLVPFGLVIEDADIENVWVVGAAHLTENGLTPTIGPHRIVCDNRLSVTTTATTITLTASDTNYVWHQPDGAKAVSLTDEPPVSRAMLLYEADTDGSGITALRDRRQFFAFGFRIQRLDFRFDATLAGAQKQRAAFLSTRPGYILPIGGIGMYLLDNGDTSGATTIDLNLRAPGGAFTTIFTSQGTEDRRPSIAHDSTVLSDTDAFPEVLAVPANSLIEVEVDAVPGGSVPAWLNVVVLIACP